MATCPSCGRRFNCDASAECWCLKVERTFDYTALILATGAASCVCPVCLTGNAEAAEPAPGPRRRGGRRRGGSQRPDGG